MTSKDAGASSSADTTLPTPSEGAGTMSDETPQLLGEAQFSP